MALTRGNAVLYKGKSHMYLGASRFLKDKHLIAREDKRNVVLTAVKTNDIKQMEPVEFKFGITKEQEAKLAKF